MKKPDLDVIEGKKLYNKLLNTHICSHCKKPTIERCLSMFSNDVICLECKEAEKKYPEYKSIVGLILKEAGFRNKK